VHIQADDKIVPVSSERLHEWKTWHWRAQFMTKKNVWGEQTPFGGATGFGRAAALILD